MKFLTKIITVFLFLALSLNVWAVDVSYVEFNPFTGNPDATRSDGSVRDIVGGVFETISPPSGDDVVAAATGDTLIFAGSGITISGNNTTKTITFTVAGGGFDSTAIDDVTWSDGANAFNTWTFDVIGTDPTITFGNNSVSVTADTIIATGKDFKAETVILTPDVEQAITAAGDTFSSSASHVEFTPDADYVMTSTPTIAAGVEGQLLILHNLSGSFTVDLQDDSVLAGSDVFLNGAEAQIKADGSMMLHYADANGGGWYVLSNPNTASAGANADILNVRNATGGALAAGKVVYITGFNVGQNRPTVDLADADDSAKMPAIGVTSASIGDGANGEVITFGNAANIIDTSGQTANDPVYVDTTAGEVVYVKPTGASTLIQRIGTVERANAVNGVVLITGAGRVNDEENLASGNIFVGDTNANVSNVAMSGEATMDSLGAITLADGVTVNSWVLGTSSATQFTSPLLLTNLLDTTGAADMDYGSADVTDHTFISDGGTVIIDGGITVTPSSPGLSTIGSGLTVNDDSGGTGNDDFTAETDNFATAFQVDASENTAKFDVPLTVNDTITAQAITSDTLKANNEMIVVSGASPTVDEAGGVGVDTTDDQWQYFGASKRVLPYTFEKCFTIETIAAADDNVPIFSPVDNVTFTSLRCRTVGGTSAQISVGDGSATMDTLTCIGAGQDDDGSIANASFSANSNLIFITGTVTGSVDWTNYCMRYTIDAQ